MEVSRTPAGAQASALEDATFDTLSGVAAFDFQSTSGLDRHVQWTLTDKLQRPSTRHIAITDTTDKLPHHDGYRPQPYERDPVPPPDPVDPALPASFHRFDPPVVSRTHVTLGEMHVDGRPEVFSG